MADELKSSKNQLTRYITKGRYDPAPNERGPWVRYDDAWAEIERLRALLGRAMKFVPSGPEWSGTPIELWRDYRAGDETDDARR